nr:SCO family protein [Tessaracoccus sp. ZS01]
MTDQDGNPFNLATDVTTKALALFFGYTNCPDVCPGIMADMATAKRRLPPEIVDDITLIVVTTDPARDTPEALKEYLRRVDESFIGLTGSLDLIKPAALSLGIDIAEGKQLPSGGYEVDHGSYILGFGEDRKLAVVWNEVPPGEMREDYERLIGG